MMFSQEYIIIALLVLILLLQIWNIKSNFVSKFFPREGFQNVTSNAISFDPADVTASPNTCIIIHAIKEQVIKNINKATLENDTKTIESLTFSLDNINRQITSIGC